MRLNDIKLLYMREIRSAFRERNILFNVALMPIFLYPVILWLIYSGITFVIGQTENFSSRVVIRDLSGNNSSLREEILEDNRMEERTSDDPTRDVRAGVVDIFVEVDAVDSTGNARARLTYDASRDRSRMALDRVGERLARYRDEFMESRAARSGLSRAEYQGFWIEQKNLATRQDMGRFILGLLVPLTLIVMIGMGGTYPALDTTAGERERSTWETLMTTMATRSDIVIAKYLYVTTMATIAGGLNMGAMIFSARSLMGALMGSRVDSAAFSIPWSSAPLILLFTVLLALFIAAGVMILATFARTFKEAQSAAGVFFMILILPLTFLQQPGIEFTMLLAFIPVINVCMVFREAIAGVYHWPQIGVTVGVEALCIGALLWIASVILRYEDIFTGSYEGNLVRFFRERLFRKA